MSDGSDAFLTSSPFSAAMGRDHLIPRRSAGCSRLCGDLCIWRLAGPTNTARQACLSFVIFILAHHIPAPYAPSPTLDQHSFQVVAAHPPASRAHHRHLAERNRLASNLGAQAKKRGQNVLIRRGADGKACRVREQSSTAAAVAASTPSSNSTTVVTSQAPVLSATPVPVTIVETSIIAAENNAAVPTHSSAPPPPTAQSSAAQPSSGGGSTYSGGGSGTTNAGSKLGIAWPNGDWAQPSDPNYIKNYIGTKSSWYYTWSPFSVASIDASGLEFVPMLWGPKQVSDWHAQQANWPNTVKHALFFNEPNEVSQCNISPGDSVQYWMNDFLPLRSKGIALGSAATTSAPSGLTWVRDAINACTSAGNSRADCTPE